MPLASIARKRTGDAAGVAIVMLPELPGLGSGVGDGTGGVSDAAGVCCCLRSAFPGWPTSVTGCSFPASLSLSVTMEIGPLSSCLTPHVRCHDWDEMGVPAERSRENIGARLDVRLPAPSAQPPAYGHEETPRTGRNAPSIAFCPVL